jgi:hypothetical protein
VEAAPLQARLPFLFRTLFVVSFILFVQVHLGRGWSLVAGILCGGVFVGWMLFPQLFMPRQIFRYQMGAWGEQKTASELKRLGKQGWVVRHDAAWGERGNHDHVVAGPAVFLINSKNTPDSTVTSNTRRPHPTFPRRCSRRHPGQSPAMLRQSTETTGWSGAT